MIWSPEARKDPWDIRNYIAADNLEAARRQVIRLRDAADGLVDFPLKGRAIGRGLRQLSTIYPYVIRYRVTGDRIDIIRVYHGARRVRSTRIDWIGAPLEATAYLSPI